MTTAAIRLEPGDDPKEALDLLTLQRGWSAACVLSCVGSLKSAKVRFANHPAPTALDGPFEILTLTGTLSPSGSHLHVALSDSSGNVLGGHLAVGSTVFTTAEIIIGMMPETAFVRLPDPKTGCKELVVAAPYDGGETGCGELLLDLFLFCKRQPPGGNVRVRALDPGAPHEIPAWCRLSGHTLLHAEHPFYFIQLKT
jgi:uncharacterized protein